MYWYESCYKYSQSTAVQPDTVCLNIFDRDLWILKVFAV